MKWKRIAPSKPSWRAGSFVVRWNVHHGWKLESYGGNGLGKCKGYFDTPAAAKRYALTIGVIVGKSYLTEINIP